MALSGASRTGSSGPACRCAAFPSLMETPLIEVDGERFRLTVPLQEATAFALGLSDLGCTAPPDALRQAVGILVIDALQFSEEWRLAGIVSTCLALKWPDGIS